MQLFSYNKRILYLFFILFLFEITGGQYNLMAHSYSSSPKCHIKNIKDDEKRILLVNKKQNIKNHHYLTQEMFNIEDSNNDSKDSNTSNKVVFVIRHNYELIEDINLPDSCVLEFEGGSISGKATINGNNNTISAGRIKIFDENINISGVWNVFEAYPEWFGAVGDGFSDDTRALVQVANFRNVLNFARERIYRTTKTIDLYNSIKGNNARIRAELPVINTKWSHVQALYYQNINNFYVKDLNIESNFGGLFVYGCSNFLIENYEYANIYSNYRGAKFGISLSGNNSIYCEDFVINKVRFRSRIDAINTDGIHICGGVRNGSVSNVKGTTGDDFIALNVVEGGASKTIKEIDNIVFDSCEMDKLCPLGLRIYSYNGLRIKNIKFDNCKFQITHGVIVRPTPCVRIMTTESFMQERNPSRRVNIDNICFKNCFFEVSSKEVPKIIIQDTDGSVSFDGCRWSEIVSMADIALHNNNVRLYIRNSCLTGGIQGWQWSSGNSGQNMVTIEDCKVNYPNLSSKYRLLYFGHQYAYGPTNIFVLRNVEILQPSIIDEGIPKTDLGYLGLSIFPKGFNVNNYLDFSITVDNVPNSVLYINKNVNSNIEVLNSKGFKIKTKTP